MKKLGILLIVLAVVVVILAISKNIIVRAVLVNGTKAATGIELAVKDVDLGIFKTNILMREIKIMNPEGFSEKVMADIPLVRADYDLGSFFKGRAYFKELTLDLKELAIVVNADNKVNIKEILAKLPKKEEPGPLPQFMIEKLHLKIGSVLYTSQALGGSDSRRFDLNIDEELNDIDSPQALVRVIIAKAISKSNIASLAGVDLKQIQEQLSGQAQGALDEFKGKVEEKFKDLLGR